MALDRFCGHPLTSMFVCFFFILLLVDIRAGLFSGLLMNNSHANSNKVMNLHFLVPLKLTNFQLLGVNDKKVDVSMCLLFSNRFNTNKEILTQIYWEKMKTLDLKRTCCTLSLFPAIKFTANFKLWLLIFFVSPSNFIQPVATLKWTVFAWSFAKFTF